MYEPVKMRVNFSGRMLDGRKYVVKKTDKESECVGPNAREVL